jgi:chromate transporter
MSPSELLTLALDFATLSLLAIGGALGTAPDMHRLLVDDGGLMTDRQFTDSIAIAQAAPGPNILFVTLLGWQAGGPMGALATTVGMMVPSSFATFWGWRWKTARDDSALVAALRLGLSPIAVGMTAAAGWVVAAGGNRDDPWLWVLSAVTVIVVIRTRLNMLWLIAAGAALGALGLVG